MNKLTIILFLILCTFSLYAQNNVFVLVDVSRSVGQNELDYAKQALKEVLTGSQLSRAFVSQGSEQDLVNFRLAPGDNLAIVKFGSLTTTLAISPNPSVIQNIQADVSQVSNSIRWEPTDQQTYITLAKAKIAEYAKNHNITEYNRHILLNACP